MWFFILRKPSQTQSTAAANPILEVMLILDFYASIYKELLAVPVIKGQKTGEIY
jgi:hypothetical protein